MFDDLRRADHPPASGERTSHSVRLCRREGADHPPASGERTSDGGYLGLWTPFSSSNARYHVTAAPSDLGDGAGNKLYATYREACRALTQCARIEGLPARDMGTEHELLSALQEGKGYDVWVIPPPTILQMMYNHLAETGLWRSFGARTHGGRAVKTYGSCAPLASCGVQPSWDGKPPADYSGVVRTVSMASGAISWTDARHPRALWRPVLLRPAP